MSKTRLFLYLFSIFTLLFTAGVCSDNPVKADNLCWSRLNTPAGGQSGKWVLAAGSDIDHLTLAKDGTLYCSANPSSSDYRLFKSIDGGSSWSYTGKVKDAITDIAVLPGNSSVVFYATSTKIFRSNDAAERFEEVLLNITAIGNTQEITSLDITGDPENINILVGTRSTHSIPDGGVYFLDSGQSSDWIDMGFGSYDVFRVAFSPAFSSDKQIIAVACDQKDTLMSTNLNNQGWNQTLGDTRWDNLTLESAAIAFPAVYSSNPDNESCLFYVSLDSGEDIGGAFALRGQAAPAPSSLDRLPINPEKDNLEDIGSLCVCGKGPEAFLIAGSANKSEVYLSSDAGMTWTLSNKPPTGESNTRVAAAKDFAEEGPLYAATSGAESAFSVSFDRGENWSQTGLIDTYVNRILDLAVSPDFKSDGTLFLLTAGATDSLWLSTSRGVEWERILSAAPSDRIKQILISSRFKSNGKVFLSGTGDLEPFIWKSDNSGRNFTKISSVFNNTPVNIDTWAITLDDYLFLGSYVNNQSFIYTFNGSEIIDRSEVGHQPLNCISVSKDNKTILVGDLSGGAYYSTDFGYMFEPLPMDQEKSPFSGAVSLAFDSQFDLNKVVYAADAASDRGIHRFVIDKSYDWERIDTTIPPGGKISRILTSDRGILYGVNSQEVDISTLRGGIERGLSPSNSNNCSFETLVNGLENGSCLQNLLISENQLWTIDTLNSRVLTCTDLLAEPVVLNLPLDNSIDLDPEKVVLSWEIREGASGYEWQVDTSSDFSTLTNKHKGFSTLTSIPLEDLERGSTYYWRVRATSPISGPWSQTRTFITQIDPEIKAPTLLEPKSGVLASREPLFKWSSCEGAEKYDLLVSSNDNFTALVINKCGDLACNANAWDCDIPLKYNTGYYWKVRAFNSVYTSTWSTVGIFKTKAESGGSSSGSGSNQATKSTVIRTTTTSIASKSTPEKTVASSTAVPTPVSSTPTVSVTPTTTSTRASTPLPGPVKTPTSGLTPTPSKDAQSGSFDSLVTTVAFLIGGLILLSIILLVVVIYMLKKFKTRY